MNATAKIIPINNAVSEPNSTLEFGKEYIEKAYQALTEKAGLFIREGQKDLSYQIFKSIVQGVPLAAEAPTGTGKTIAYLIGSLAAARFLSPEGKLPIVVSTATTGLQQQILQGDIPKLLLAQLLNEAQCIIAKGRGRYFCVAQAENMEQASKSSQVDLFDEELNKRQEALEIVSEMLEHFHAGVWDGDIDGWKGLVPSNWEDVKANSETCTNKKCEFFAQCPFFRERMKLSEGTVIVANHDLVLSDLILQKTEKEPLFPSNRYIAVFDEGHHLPDKAIEAGSSKVDLAELKQSLQNLGLFAKGLNKLPDLQRFLAQKQMGDEEFNPQDALAELENLINLTKFVEVDKDSKIARFSQELPQDLVLCVHEFSKKLKELNNNVLDASSKIKNSKQLADSPLVGPKLTEIILRLSSINSELKAAITWAAEFTNGNRLVRWIYKSDLITQFYCAPLEGKDVLDGLLWESPRALPIIISATLRDFEGFDRFKAKSGLPTNADTYVLKPIFAYKECQLIFGDFKNSPKFETKEKFFQELSEKLSKYAQPKTGNLILFPSKTLMNYCLPMLRKHHGKAVLAQGDQSFKLLIQEHKDRVDRGQYSILCGLATMAEGLDLPGNYCTNVIITALPFSVPTNPVEQELQEVLGDKYFEQRALPDALVKLIQMVGRLVRRESDRGRIIVCDNRLIKTKYGRKMIAALPPFEKRYEKPSDLWAVNTELRSIAKGVAI